MRKIGGKFLFIFILLAVIGLSGMVVMAMNLNNIRIISETMTAVELVDYKEISEMRTGFEMIQKSIAKHVMTNNENKCIIAENSIKKTQGRMGEILSSLESRTQNTRGDSVEAEAMYGQLVEAYGIYGQYLEQVLEISKTGDKAAAQKSMWSNLSNCEGQVETCIDNLQTFYYSNLEAVEGTLKQYTNNVPFVVGTAVGLMILAVILSYLLAHQTIIRPIKKSTKGLKEIMEGIHNGDGDLSIRVPVTTRDEIGALARGINEFVGLLQGIIQNIQGCIGEIVTAQDEVFRAVDGTNGSTEDISICMEMIAGSMEEVEATMISNTQNTETTKKGVSQMATKSRSGSEFAHEVKNKAERLREKGVESKRAAVTTMEKMEVEVKRSVEESKEIQQISALTDEILGIAGQTNLLALNASIEAARAGEAGRGFAVVAEEIRKLADDSRATANRIQDISKNVIQSVSNLSENTNELLKFTNKNVLVDYDVLVNTSDEYFMDAVTVDERMNDIYREADKLDSIIGQLADANKEIADTLVESTRELSLVAGKSTSVAEEMKTINKALSGVGNVTGTLEKEIRIFALTGSKVSG